MPRGGRGSHSTSVPAPLTESAMQARKSFYCELCSKGYSRMNEFEAHESSYDHQHKKRFMEMKQMQKGSTTAEARRERERRAEEKAGLITIKPITLGSGVNQTGVKGTDSSNHQGSKDGDISHPPKRGFKSAFAATTETLPVDRNEKTALGRGGFKKAFTSTDEQSGSSFAAIIFQEKGVANIDHGSDIEDDNYTEYNPMMPT